MNQDKYVFAQFVEFLNNNKFRRLVDKNVRYANENADYRRIYSLMQDKTPLQECSIRLISIMSKSNLLPFFKNLISFALG